MSIRCLRSIAVEDTRHERDLETVRNREQGGPAASSGATPAHVVAEDPRGQALDALVSGGCIVSGASIVRSSLFTDVTVERGSVVEDSVLLPKVRIGRNVRLRHAVVDKFCVLPDGFAAGLGRAEDEARFHVTPRGVVLITPEMLGHELHEFG